MNLEELSKLSRSKLLPIKQRAIVALITQQVHNRDVLEKIKELEINSTSDFFWQQQMRYFMDIDNNDIFIRQITSLF